MDYKRILRLHYVNKLSYREIADSCGDCSKSAVGEFLKRFKDCQELSYPLKEEVTNEYIESSLYKKSGVSADLQLYRDFDKEAVHKALSTISSLESIYTHQVYIKPILPFSFCSPILF